MARAWNTDAERARWQRRNERARELGYSSASAMAKARREGRPSPADTAAPLRAFRAGDRMSTGAVRTRSFTQATITPATPAQTARAATRAVERQLDQLGPSARLTITVQLPDGTFRTVTPQGGITAQQLDQLVRDYGGAAGSRGGRAGRSPIENVADHLAQLAGYHKAKGSRREDDEDDEDDEEYDDDDSDELLSIELHVSEG